MNYYQLLELNPKATRDEITQAYNRKKESLTGQSLSDVKRAYLILLDPKERIRYDSQLLKDTNSSTQSSNAQAHHVEVETKSLLALEELEAKSYYERLSVGNNENAMAIKKAYAQAARLYSNEQYPNHFILIREAFETLFDTEKRKEYDAYLDGFDAKDDYVNYESYYHHSNDETTRSTTSDTQSTQSTYTPINAPSSGSSRVVWGWIVAVLGSFIFTPVLAIPIGMIIGMGLSGAISFVFKFFSTIITIVVIILLFILIFG
ncbi:DnaJ domain-containing protein [Exiguobacterium sp. MH3]|uniref:DnaJ domain-containing protein n=1 Tax=Exiguobacterium sp. MH3 TaxID=1399115 RepID=UPI0003C3ECAC|nr:DnaJ domain-containing protein [Exiguobacterium sp. MH3]AHA31554.1 hypothetical protein U719_14750 [Exiguobacterium sp. MH3]